MMRKSPKEKYLKWMTEQQAWIVSRYGSLNLKLLVKYGPDPGTWQHALWHGKKLDNA